MDKIKLLGARIKMSDFDMNSYIARYKVKNYDITHTRERAKKYFKGK